MVFRVWVYWFSKFCCSLVLFYVLFIPFKNVWHLKLNFMKGYLVYSVTEIEFFLYRVNLPCVKEFDLRRWHLLNNIVNCYTTHRYRILEKLQWRRMEIRITNRASQFCTVKTRVNSTRWNCVLYSLFFVCSINSQFLSLRLASIELLLFSPHISDIFNSFERVYEVSIMRLNLVCHNTIINLFVTI